MIVHHHKAEEVYNSFETDIITSPDVQYSTSIIEKHQSIMSKVSTIQKEAESRFSQTLRDSRLMDESDEEDTFHINPNEIKGLANDNYDYPLEKVDGIRKRIDRIKVGKLKKNRRCQSIE